MGPVYCGPYAEQVGYEHEGYAARVSPDSTSTNTDEIVAYIAACGCGWAGQTRYPATASGKDEAIAEWDRAHLQPLIEFARRTWHDWAERVAARARHIAQQVTDGHLTDSELVMERLTDDVNRWSQTFRALIQETDATEK